MKAYSFQKRETPRNGVSGGKMGESRFLIGDSRTGWRSQYATHKAKTVCWIPWSSCLTCEIPPRLCYLAG